MSWLLPQEHLLALCLPRNSWVLKSGCRTSPPSLRCQVNLFEWRALPSEVPWSPWVKLLPPRRPSDGHLGQARGSAPCLLPLACFLGSPASKSLQIHLQSVPEPAWRAPGSLDLSGQPLSCALRSRALRARRPSPRPPAGSGLVPGRQRSSAGVLLSALRL